MLSTLISIHAPARGATVEYLKSQCMENISIHAPARGATGTDRKFYRVQHHFNPRSREGSDRNSPKNREKEKAISIHAPARGATGRWQKHLAFPNFNPRSREGSDTHPIITLSRKLMNFNPRSREGSDGQAFAQAPHPVQFQSTLPRGERLQFYLKFTLCF